MFDIKNLDDVVKKLIDAIPPNLRESLTDTKKDLEKNFRAVLQATLSKMNLITREEFDVQKQVLKRTREKLDALEKKINSLTKTKRTKK